MSDRQASCEDRIAAQMEGREESFGNILNPPTDDGAACLRLAVEEGWDEHTDDEVETLIARIEAVNASDGAGDEVTYQYPNGSSQEPPFDPDDLDLGSVVDVFDAWWDEAKDFLQDERDITQQMLEMPLALSTRISMRVELSTGGPGDWLEVGLDVDGYNRDVEFVNYHFNDWFDHAERPVSEDSPLWAAAEWYAEIVDIPGSER